MNTLIVIGFMGIKRCYLNVTEEEALRRYKESDAYLEEIDCDITIFQFDDEFGAYDAYAIN